MAEIRRLRTRPVRLRAEQADVLKQALLPFEAGELAPHVHALIGLIDRETAAELGWTFVMLSPSQNALVVNYIAAHSARPIMAMRVWALCFEHLRHDTGEIMLRRDEIAEKVGESSANVSAIMSELVRFGAIIRQRERVGGMKGQGLVRYFMNPRVGTHLAGRERDDAQRRAPQLKLV